MTTPIFHIQTFGCQMNVNDSQWLARSLVARGFKQGEFDEASLHIINTCSVRDKPERKVYSELGRIAHICKVKKRTNVTVCVGGCVAQQVGPNLAKRFPQVRLLFGTDGISQAPDAICRLMENFSLRLNLLEFVERYEERADIWLATPEKDAAAHVPEGTASPFATPLQSDVPFAESAHRNELAVAPDDLAQAMEVPASVCVNIMQGCNNFCTYCIVPYVRGRQKSRSSEAILAECETLLAKGAREITLLGQNVNSYGQDGQVQGITFAQLLHKVAALPDLARLRIMTPHPKDIAQEVIDAFSTMDMLCPRLHLPMQSGSDRILAAMGRKYDTARYLDIVRRLKEARPDITFSTDMIVGFPGETEQDFQDTLHMMQEVGFVFSYSFVYSDRPYAKAALLPDKVDRNVALERLSRLQAWQDDHTAKLLQAMQGQESIVLLEHKSQRAVVLENTVDKVQDREKEYWQGRTPQGFLATITLPPCPETTPSGWKGQLIPVHIESAARHSLKGRQAGTT